MIDIVDLCVDIGGTRIVSDVTINVPNRTFVGLLGPNGSGKSTILKTMYRLLKPAAGQVLIDGQDLLALPAKQAATRIAVVSQDTTVEFDATVAEVVMVGRTPHKGRLERDNDWDRAVVTDALQRVGCLGLAHRSIHALSGGERQRVFIARALAQGCDHLILDEPTNHLDVRYQMEVLEIVAGLGISVLAALHDLGLAGLFCDSIYLLDGGRIAAQGPPEAVITPDIVRQVYGADVLVLTHPEAGTPLLIPRRATSHALDARTLTEGIR